MAASISAHENKSTKRPVKHSLSEIKAAKLLIQLSSGDSEEDSSNNSSSYSVVQEKPRHHCGDVSSSSSSIAAAAEDVLSDSEDESFARRNKRYRCIEELYSVTNPLPAVVKAKMMKRRK